MFCFVLVFEKGFYYASPPGLELAMFQDSALFLKQLFCELDHSKKSLVPKTMNSCQGPSAEQLPALDLSEAMSKPKHPRLYSAGMVSPPNHVLFSLG